jgi:hypothetical protein
MTTPYNDLLQTTINNNVLRIDYQDNINVLEQFNRYNPEFPSLMDRTSPRISINSADFLLLSVQDPSGSYFQQYSLNNIITPGLWSGNVSSNSMIYPNILLIIDSKKKIILYINYISYDSQNRIIIFGKDYDNINYYIIRIFDDITLIQKNILLGADPKFNKIGYVSKPFPNINTNTYIPRELFIDYDDNILVSFNDSNNNTIFIKYDSSGNEIFTSTPLNIGPDYSVFLNAKPMERNYFYIFYYSIIESGLGLQLGLELELELELDLYLYQIDTNGIIQNLSQDFINNKVSIYYKNLVIDIDMVESALNDILSKQLISNISIYTDNNNKIIFVGNTNISGTTIQTSDIIIYRYNSDGTPDNTFNTSNPLNPINYIIDDNNGNHYTTLKIDGIQIDSHNNIYIAIEYYVPAITTPITPSYTQSYIKIYNDNGIINNKTRIYTKVSLDGGETYQYMNNYQKITGTLGKNTLLINLSNTNNNFNLTNLEICLQTNANEITNTLTVSNGELISNTQYKLLLNWIVKLTNYITQVSTRKI